MGVEWVRQIDRTYDVARMRDTLKEALTTQRAGPKVIVASSECMLNKQRREKPLFAKAVEGGQARGAPALRGRRGRLHRRSRLHPALGLPFALGQADGDPLKDDPVAAIDNSCVGCGNCGEVAEAAVLCPSFYRADIVNNPDRLGPRPCPAARSGHRLPAAPARSGGRDFA